MKIIDLLNKIANGEYPDFKYNDSIWRYNYHVFDYANDKGDWLLEDNFNFNNINKEIEIIEDNKKIEKLNVDDIDYFTMNNKINELIDVINELGDKE